MKHRTDLTPHLIIAVSAMPAVLIAVLVIGVRLTASGGDLGCLLADDPALCAGWGIAR